MSEPETSATTSVGLPDRDGGSRARATDQCTYDLCRFTLADMVRCGRTLRELASHSGSMEEAAQKIARHLYDNLRDRVSDDRSSVLVRFFKTQAYSKLTAELRKFASASCPHPIDADTKCLTLLGTAGDNPQWNSRKNSEGHKCIALLSEAIVEQFPMISQLIRQLGLTTVELLRPTPEIIRDIGQKSFGVFYVPTALESPFLPAQKDFVRPYAVTSVFGFGGILPDGELFAVIVFTHVVVPASTAEIFRTIAVNLKLGLLDLIDKPVFAD